MIIDKSDIEILQICHSCYRVSQANFNLSNNLHEDYSSYFSLRNFKYELTLKKYIEAKQSPMNWDINEAVMYVIIQNFC